MDWSNVNLNSAWERSQCLLDGYDFETLLTEISCNISTKELTKEAILKQFNESLECNIRSAKEIMQNNVESILKYELEQRED